MYVEGVCKCYVWRHKVSGRTVSIFGAAPWTSDAQRAEWEKVERGWTTKMSNNTIGSGRQPFASKEEAEAFMHEWNRRVGR